MEQGMDARMAKLETQLGGVVRTLDEHIKDQKTDLGRLEGKVDAVATTIACLNDRFVSKDEYQKKMTSMDTTIENLKKFRWQLIAGGTVAIYILEKIGFLK